jgi:endonuclease/exonuclease/phosphatase family metal-dependent hydrolase
MLRRSIQFLIFLMVALPSPFSVAQKPPAGVNDPLLESGPAGRISAPAKRPAEIRIVSYNIRWRSGKELQQIVDWLQKKEVSPAIIGLQEVDRARQRSGNTNNARALAESLGMYYAWAAPPAAGNEQEEETGVALFSPYPLTDLKRIVLRHAGPGGRYRVALGATIKLGKITVRVYSVHSETRIPVPQKIDQLQAVLDDLKRFPNAMPAIVLGDFNSWELPAIEGIHRLFQSNGFATPFPDDQTTFKRKVIGLEVELKLDWIWLRGLSAEQYEIDRALIVSDHYPLWTVAKLSGG